MNDISKIGKYTVVRVIGEGGMGRVYEATDPVIGRHVAIKVISLGTDTPEARARFFREAQAAGGLSHPNIITIHDIGGDAGESPYIVMEFLEGSDLSLQLAGAPMAIEKKVQIAVDICEGLAHAHERGIIHRDIKPANVFISAQGHAKIVDFGLARGEASDITHTGAILGTPNYMAPEQIRGEAIDQRADIFSVGVVLYELFSGRKPFAGDSVASTIYKVLQTEPPLIHTVDTALPPALSNVIQRAIAKDKTQRYQTVRELHDALVALLWTGRRAEPIDLTAFTIPMKVAGGVREARSSRNIAWIVGGAAAVLAVAVVAFAIIGRPRQRTEPPAQVANATPAAVPAQGGSKPEAAATTDRPATPDTTPAPSAPAEPRASATPPRSEPTRDSRRTDQSQATAAPPRTEAARDSRRGDQPRSDRERADMARSSPPAPAPQTPSPATKPAEPSPQPSTPPVREQAQMPPTTTSVVPAPTVTPPTPPEPRVETRRPPEPAPVTAPPATAALPSRPNADAASRETNAAAAIQRIVDDYRAALEARDLTALKRIWPTLSGRQEDAIRSEFDHTRTIRVGLSNIQTTVAGSIATVSCRRAYAVTTADGQRLDTASKMTMTLSGRDGAWVIDNIRFEAAQ
jgi:serine/threonine-protein kinase